MPQDINAIPEPIGPITVPSTGDPRDSGPIRAIAQKLLNMVAGAAQTATPTGSVQAYAGPAAPSGWLLCNGQAVSRSNYSALYSAIGTTFGPGDNSTTFNLPDLRGRVAVGAGQGPSLTNRSRGQAGGEETHALTQNELPAHTHLAPTIAGTLPGSGTLEIAGTPNGGVNVYDYVNAAPTSSVGGNAAHNNLQPYLTLNYIIRT